MVGQTWEQGGQILGDWARFYRHKNLLAIFDKVQAQHKRRNLEGKTNPIPVKFVLPMIEAASLADDKTLQDLWANLIAKSMDPNFTEPFRVGYIEIIKQMSPDDAIILMSFMHAKSFPLIIKCQIKQEAELFVNSLSFIQSFSRRRAGAANKSSIEKDDPYRLLNEKYLEICKSLPLKYASNAIAALDNLQRLQLVELGNKTFVKPGEISVKHRWPKEEGPLKAVSVREEYLQITAFGRSFLEICRADEESKV